MEIALNGNYALVFFFLFLKSEITLVRCAHLISDRQQRTRA